MEITIYAPTPETKKITARHAIQSLGEHYTSFLNHNNLSDWKADEEYILREDLVSDILLTIGASRGLYIGQIKHQAKRIKKLMLAGGAEISLTSAYDIAARALGYSTYQVAFGFRDRDDYVDNLWPYGNAFDLRLLSATVDPLKFSQTSPALQRRAAHNKKRCEARNELKQIAKSDSHTAKLARKILHQQRNRTRSKNATSPIIPRD